jgi:uncharacterized protein (DUF302 family)
MQLAEAPTDNKSITALPDEERMVYVKKRRKPLSVLYKSIFRALEHNGYFVLIEPNIGKNLEHFAQRWGTDYNKNKLEEIRSMVFCNAWYANKVANADPYMLALCPLHITLFQKGNMTTIVFVRPGKVASQSPAREVAEELEKDVIRIIENAV